MDTSLFLQSESGIRNICKLYVLSSKGTKFHRGCTHSLQITIEIKSFSIWRGGVGDSCRLPHLESPGSIPSRALFLDGNGYILYITLKHGLRIILNTICFLFIYFSMRFLYNANRTSSDGRIAPALFLTDCWATLTGKDKQYILIICSHGTQPRRGRTT